VEFRSGAFPRLRGKVPKAEGGVPYRGKISIASP
jgi:hypothetical protein